MGKKMTGLEVLLIAVAAFVIGKYIHWVLAAVAVVVYFIYRFRKDQEDRQKLAKEYKSKNINAFNSLGSSKEEREKSIIKMFDEKKATIKSSFFYDYKYDPIGYDMWLTQSRNLSIMEPKEREFLRMTFLLYNNSYISEDNFHYYLYAFVNGNGKAALDEKGWKIYHKGIAKIEDRNAVEQYMKDNCFKDNQTFVKFSQDALDTSVDSAITNLLKRIEGLDTQNSSSEGVRYIKSLKKYVYGGNIWLSRDDIETSVFNNSNTPYKLTLGHLADDPETIVSYSGEGSLMTIAPPRSGKSQCLVIPNMLQWKGSSIVLDISGELYNATSKWRSQNIGPVYKFNPLDPSDSHCYNPLTFVRQDSEYIWEDSRLLADMMIVPSGTSENSYWENMARDVLTAAISYISFYNAPSDRPMSKVMDIFYGIGWDEMITSLKTNIKVAAMRRMGNSLSDIEKKQRDDILRTGQSSLSAWQGERISRTTEKSDWNPLDLRTKGNITIYICIRPNEIDAYISILRVLIAQHVEILLDTLPERNTFSPVLFMLDEFPRLKNMPPIDKALNAGAKYGIRLWMFAQSYGQLQESYKNAEGMLGSCAVRCFMNLPLNDELTTKISEQLGYRDGAMDSSPKRIVEPIELSGPDFQNLILVISTGTKPVKLQKKFSYQDSELIAKMK